MRLVLPYVLFALTLIVCAGAVVAEVQRRALDPPHSTLTGDILLIALVFGGVGLLVARARPCNVVGWIFLISGLEWAAWGTLNDQLRAVLLDGAPDVLGAALLLEWVGRWSWVSVVMPAVLFAPMLFPDGRLLSPRWWPLPVAGLASAPATTVRIAFSPGDYPSSGVPGLANLDAFGARLRDEVDLDDVRAVLLGAVGETLRPAYASLWLRRDRQ